MEISTTAMVARPNAKLKKAGIAQPVHASQFVAIHSSSATNNATTETHSIPMAARRNAKLNQVIAARHWELVLSRCVTSRNAAMASYSPSSAKNAIIPMAKTCLMDGTKLTSRHIARSRYITPLQDTARADAN